MPELLLQSLILTLAGLVYGLTGFGFGLVALPVLALVLEPAVAVPLIIALTLPLSFYLAFAARADLDGALLLPLLGGAAAGIPIGGLLLRAVPAEAIKIAVGVVVISVSILMLRGWSHPLRSGRLAPLLTGGLGGMLGAGLGLPGPPVILFLSNQGAPKAVFRATLMAFFAAANVVTMVSYFVLGLADSHLLRLSLLHLPLTITGALVGALWARHLAESTFRRVALWLMLVSAGVLVASNVSRVL